MRNVARYRVAMAVVLWSVLSAGSGAVAQEARTVREKVLKESVPTVHGLLEVYQLNFDDGGHTHQLTQAGRVVREEPDYESLSIVASYPDKGPARIVLLIFNTGGNACPSFYKVLEVKDDGRLNLSEEFGNCSPLAKPSFSQGVLDITLPPIGRAAEQSWRYAEGQLSKVKAPSRTRKRKP